MVKLTYSLLILTLLNSCSRTQSISYPHRLIDLNTQTVLTNRMVDYNSSVKLADSLFEEFNKSRFDMETSIPNKFSDGLVFIMESYQTAKNFATDTTYVDNQLTILEEQINTSTNKAIDKAYQDVVDKAEECNSNGNKEKAVELYKRAIIFRPEDEKIAKRLAEIENL